MKRILISIEYRGDNFCGWQVQPGKRTVEGELEEVLSSFFNEKIELFASGRTDSGVHAISQFAHFNISSDFNVNKLPFAINTLLKSDIKIKSAKEVDDSFHARYNIKKKTYEYKLYISKIASPLKNGLYAQIQYELNIEEMKKAAKHLIGDHDFSAFMASKSGAKTTVREIYNLEIEKKEDEVFFEITGNGFLYNMVRIIVGTLVDVGLDRLKPRDVKEILLSKDRKLASKTMPACGLYLKDVEY